MAGNSKLDIPLREWLGKNKERVLSEWLKLILPEQSEFFETQQDRFANPVGFAFRKAADSICQAIIDGVEVDRDSIEYAIKIKALEGNDPAAGVAFIRSFGDIVRKTQADFIRERDLAELDSRLDQIAAVAAELFVACRLQIALLSGKLD